MEPRETIDLKHENILGEGPIKLNVGHSRMRAIYYRKIGGQWVGTGLLPADPTSIQHYFSKGFKAKPPIEEVKSDGTISCPICGFGAKDVFGLQSHLRKHINKKKEDKT